MDENELRAVGRRLARARENEATAYEAARLAALKALEFGVAEAVVARELGVNRMTVRKWLGKR